MRSNARMIIIAMLLTSVGLGQVQAAMQPNSYPQETRLVQFVYDSNRTYDILTRPNAITDIQLTEGETLTALALGDTVQWVYDQAPNHIFIKPSRANIFTSATIVTNKRSYQLQLRAMPADGNWYQRVTWRYPQLVVARQLATAKKNKEKERIAGLEAGPISSAKQLDFDYRIQGKAKFRPISVFDDGRFIWLKMPANAQITPAVFIKRGRKLVLVNYTVRGDYIVVQRLADTLVLKAGKPEVVIRRHGSASNWNARSQFDF
ncbi:MAG: TrbG/VirB9 family P-type conjugative transfer protein [Candidatus Thiodiazotropha lotti]|nr:TrbG/VirB9 family P-type conjugative transfer protein [Candidatus Thiodiazotropha lotti]